jgi:HlyD family secretion protein
MKKNIDTQKITSLPKNTIKMVHSTSKKVYAYSPKLVWGVLALVTLGGAYTYFKTTETKSESYIVARGSLEEAVSVTGKIKASTDAELSFEKGGTVNRVLVKEGQKVRVGQTLVTLSGGTDYGQVLEARAQIQSAQAQLELLKNGTRREEVAVSAAGLSGAKTELSNGYATIGDSVRSSYNNASDAIRYKTQGFFTGTLSSNYSTVPNTCNSQLEVDAAALRKQVEYDLIAWSKINTTNMSDSQKETVLSDVQGYINRTTSLIELMNSIVNAPCVANDLSLETYRIAISGARGSLSSAQAEITLKKNALSSARAGISKAETGLTLTSAGSEPEKIRIQEAAVRQAYARLYQAQAASSKNVITAPGSGIVTKVDIAAGEYASPGKTVLRIVGTGEYTVEADVTESDIARIILDNSAKVIIPAIDAKETFSGKIVSIDPAEQSEEGNPLYRIIVSLEGSDPRIKSGMTAETTIVTSVVENLLRVPTRFITKIKGISKAQVVVNSKTLETEERDIKTGRKSTDGNTEIVSGLEEGEIIVLPKVEKK